MGQSANEPDVSSEGELTLETRLHNMINKSPTKKYLPASFGNQKKLSQVPMIPRKH